MVKWLLCVSTLHYISSRDLQILLALSILVHKNLGSCRLGYHGQTGSHSAVIAFWEGRAGETVCCC